MSCRSRNEESLMFLKGNRNCEFSTDAYCHAGAEVKNYLLRRENSLGELIDDTSNFRRSPREVSC